MLIGSIVNLVQYVLCCWMRLQAVLRLLLVVIRKITTRCHKKDHYPYKLRKMYRTKTVLTEFVNIRTMFLEIRQNGL